MAKFAKAPKEVVDEEGVAARVAATLLGEAFLDLAVALGRVNAREARRIITDLERNVVARLKQFGEIAGPGQAGTVDVQVMAANFIREFTQEAKQRIVDAGSPH